MRIEPPPSEPCAAGASPAATAAAAPPLEPPGVRERSQGLRQVPFSSRMRERDQAELGRVRLPDHDEAGRAQAAGPRRRRRSGTCSAKARDERVVRIPSVSVRSLIGSGTPENGPGRGERASASAARRRR